MIFVSFSKILLFVGRNEKIQNAIEQYKYLDDAIRIASDSSSRTHKPTLADLCLSLFLITEQIKDDHDYEEDETQEDGSLLLAERSILTYDDIESLYDVLQEYIVGIDPKGCSNKRTKNVCYACDLLIEYIIFA